LPFFQRDSQSALKLYVRPLKLFAMWDEIERVRMTCSGVEVERAWNRSSGSGQMEREWQWNGAP